jgi:hypothetical protein
MASTSIACALTGRTCEVAVKAARASLLAASDVELTHGAAGITAARGANGAAAIPLPS